MIGRRGFMRAGGTALAVGTIGPVVGNFILRSPLFTRPETHRDAGSPSLDRTGNVRTLSLANAHTGESFDNAYWENGRYDTSALAMINYVLRDHRTDEVHVIDPRLLDLLHALRDRLGSAEPFRVLSGYRSPSTNALLCEEGAGASKHSLHMSGMAIDIRLKDRTLDDLHSAAVDLRLGGVGYYPSSDFVHVDVGRLRYWVGGANSPRRA